MRKLSFEENLRHRLERAPRFRYRDRSSRSEGLLFLAVGAVAGITAGALLVQKFGGVGALTDRLRERFTSDEDEAEPGRRGFASGTYDEEYEESYEDGESGEGGAGEELSPTEELEERVLDAYHNDPVLSERAIDIGAIDEGIIELTGWVYSAEEAEHAVTVARGTPGVDTVVNRLAVRALEDRFDALADRYSAGDDQLTEAHWEGQRVGTGRPRQGNSGEPGRHADPKVPLEDRWMDESEAYRDAADEVEGLAERRERPKREAGGRTDGSPVAPTGVPKGDHVAHPEDAPPSDETRTTRP